jgi:hypothetical protein
MTVRFLYKMDTCRLASVYGFRLGLISVVTFQSWRPNGTQKTQSLLYGTQSAAYQIVRAQVVDKGNQGQATSPTPVYCTKPVRRIIVADVLRGMWKETVLAYLL